MLNQYIGFNKTPRAKSRASKFSPGFHLKELQELDKVDVQDWPVDDPSVPIMHVRKPSKEFRHIPRTAPSCFSPEVRSLVHGFKKKKTLIAF